MKSQDLQKLVLSKHQNGEKPNKIFRDLQGAISRTQVFQWCKMIAETSSIELSTSPGRPRIIRTKNMIQKVKNRLKRKKRVSTRKLANELKISGWMWVWVWIWT